MKKTAGAVAAMAVFGLTACQQQVNSPAQKTICESTELMPAQGTCKDGDVFAFLPDVFGNEQLPVMAAAMSCDFRYPIVQTKGGVSCIYKAGRQVPKDEPVKTP
ncbi:MAG: hypothetical protein ACOY58_02350 [Candidatus Micrarchaeota archaeon]